MPNGHDPNNKPPQRALALAAGVGGLIGGVVGALIGTSLH